MLPSCLLHFFFEVLAHMYSLRYYGRTIAQHVCTHKKKENKIQKKRTERRKKNKFDALHGQNVAGAFGVSFGWYSFAMAGLEPKPSMNGNGVATEGIELWKSKRMKYLLLSSILLNDDSFASGLLLVCFDVSLNFSFCLNVNSCWGIQTRISYFYVDFRVFVCSRCCWCCCCRCCWCIFVLFNSFFSASFVMICWRCQLLLGFDLPSTKSDERWLMLVRSDFDVWQTNVSIASHRIALHTTLLCPY